MATESQSARCPFYIRETPTTIYCEGVIRRTTIKNIFATERHAVAHRCRYCNRIKGYRECGLYEAVLGKYERKDL